MPKWAPKKNKQEQAVDTLLEVMQETRAYTLEELIRAEPDRLKGLLCMYNLETLIHNSAVFVQTTMKREQIKRTVTISIEYWYIRILMLINLTVSSVCG